MNILKASLIVLVSTTSLHASAQTVDDVVNKYVQAIGGRDALSKVKTIIIQSDVSVMGQSFPSVTTMVVNQGYKNVTTVNGSEIIQCFTPDGGWSVNPMMGATSPTPVSDDEKKAGFLQIRCGRTIG